MTRLEMATFLRELVNAAEIPDVTAYKLGLISGELLREQTVTHQIPASPNLDAITLHITDHGAGRGTLTVVCWSYAWTCFWGAMGERGGVLGFVADTDEGYVANCLIRGRQTWITNNRERARELEHLEKICRVVVAYARSAQ